MAKAADKPTHERLIGIDPQLLAEFQAEAAAYPKQFLKAQQRAVNRALDVANTHARKTISAELGIKQADLSRPHRFGATRGQSTGQALRKIPASGQNATARLRISGRRIPVVFFRARATKLIPQKPILVRYRGKTILALRRGTGVSWRIGSRGRSDALAFMGRARKGNASDAAEGHSGHVGVWKREKGRPRLPIVELKGPSIPHVAERNAAFRTALDTNVQPLLVNELRRQVALITVER